MLFRAVANGCAPGLSRAKPTSPPAGGRRRGAALPDIAEMYKEQIRGGRWFLHEHPAMASSWDLEEMTNLEKEEGVKISMRTNACMG